MRKGATRSILVGVVLVVALLASNASAATLIGDYQFQGTRASSGPGALLVDVGGSNSFQTDSVLGTTRQVLRFPEHSGLRMAPAGIGGTQAPYSVVTTFKFTDADLSSSYARILDPSPGDSVDRGIYSYDERADIYPSGAEVYSPQAYFEPDHYATVAITSAPPTATKVFVNGAFAVQAPETIDVLSDTLRFFKDNDSPPNNQEDSAGAVSCIRVFSGVLSDSEVSAIGASATCQAPPKPPQLPAAVAPRKKCKKHKHRSAQSAKKKCKKKGKS